MKLWLDTDIGDDIDDALTLEAILNDPKIELLGISTVFKNSPLRAMLAQEMVKRSGKNVPIYAGKSLPLQGLRKINHGEIYNQYGKELEPIDQSFIAQAETNQASEAMLKAMKDHPDAYVLAIGPLTNLGVAVSLDKERLLSNHPIFFMGGDWKRRVSEWNLLCDVEAAARLFKAKLDLYAIGLEETEKTRMSKEEEERMRSTGSGPLNDYRRKLVERFKQATHWEITPHDCLAYYALLNRNNLLWDKGRPQVEVEGEDAYIKISEGDNLHYLESFDRLAFINWLCQSMN